MNRRQFFTHSTAFAAAGAVAAQTTRGKGKLRAGAATAVITPPVGASLAGYFTESFSRNNHDELLVKAIVFDNGSTRVALAVCDLCVLPFEVVSKAKRRIAETAQIPIQNIALSCTHTHSAPATMHLFQSQPDDEYLQWLTSRIVDSVRMAVERLEPAKVGFGFGSEKSIIFNRRFFMKPGTMPPNPFGAIDQVQTNPGIGNPNVIKAAGPVDPTVGVLSVQAADGTPLAMIGNYSLHYVGGQKNGDVSADYFAFWAESMARRAAVTPRLQSREFVAILTNGCQGDINNVNVLQAAPKAAPYVRMREVAEILAEESFRVWKQIQHKDEVELGGSEEWLALGVRIPTVDELSIAKQILGAVKNGPPYRDAPAVFAREAVVIADSFPPIMPVAVQALRIGELAMAAFSGEPFVELGLEIRKKSAIQSAFPIGLANGHAGYLPTTEAMELGGYETWRAKSSFLEKEAGPKVVQAMLRRLSALGG